jgi:hypothetical protein
MELAAGIVGASPPGFKRANPILVMGGQGEQGVREPRRVLVGQNVRLNLAEGDELSERAFVGR